jgi:hypothetical protein
LAARSLLYRSCIWFDAGNFFRIRLQQADFRNSICSNLASSEQHDNKSILIHPSSSNTCIWHCQRDFFLMWTINSLPCGICVFYWFWSNDRFFISMGCLIASSLPPAWVHILKHSQPDAHVNNIYRGRESLTTFLTRAKDATDEAFALQFSSLYGGVIMTSSITTMESFAHRHGNL